MKPARSSAVSWIDAIKALRYCFFIALHLQQHSRRNNSREGSNYRRPAVRRRVSSTRPVRAVLFFLGEAMNENGPSARPEHFAEPTPKSSIILSAIGDRPSREWSYG